MGINFGLLVDYWWKNYQSGINDGFTHMTGDGDTYHAGPPS